MQKKTLQRLAWAVGLTFALLLPFTVIPGLNFDVHGQWGTRIWKFSQGYDTAFVFKFPNHSMGYAFKPQHGRGYSSPKEGCSYHDGNFTFRRRTFELMLLQGKRGDMPRLLGPYMPIE